MPQKMKSVYICSECGYESAKWSGKCPGCGQWNTMNEEFKESSKASAAISSVRRFLFDIARDRERRVDMPGSSAACKQNFHKNPSRKRPTPY